MMKHPPSNMATILSATSTAGRKGLKPSSFVGKQVRDQVERANREDAGQKATRRHSLADKEKGRVEEVPKNKHHFSATRVGRFAASPLLPRSKAPTGEKLMAASIAATKGA